MPDPAAPQVLCLCLDVNVLIADFLARRKGGSGGASSRLVDMVRDRLCALGPVQMVVSWRMLTTLRIVLQRDFQVSDEAARAICDLLAAAAEFGPLNTPPLLTLGGTGLPPMQDAEDAGVAETALTGGAHLLVTHDLDDFEAGPKSRLPTRRLLSRSNGKAGALLICDAAKGNLLAAIPALEIGWLRGQTKPPLDVLRYRAAPG